MKYHGDLVNGLRITATTVKNGSTDPTLPLLLGSNKRTSYHEIILNIFCIISINILHCDIYGLNDSVHLTTASIMNVIIRWAKVTLTIYVIKSIILSVFCSN